MTLQKYLCLSYKTYFKLFFLSHQLIKYFFMYSALLKVLICFHSGFLQCNSRS